ncbi:MAG TPA: DUF969 domain-containing protein [Burkholderiaceae bacterium]
MAPDVSLWPLLGVAVIIAGFVLRFNPMIVVIGAAIVTALIAKFGPLGTLAAIGTGFLKTRNLTLALILPLATIGLLERHGLRQHAQAWIQRFRQATAGQLLIVYLGVRELCAAVGLTGLGGHVQMVRPLIAPMAEGAAQARHGVLPDRVRYRLRAMAASADNVGLFFGEDIFVAFGAVVLITTFLHEAGITVEPLHVALWGIPTAVVAFVVHAWRLHRLDRTLAREMGPASADGAAEVSTGEATA